MVIYESNRVHVSYHEEKGYIKEVFSSFVPSDEIKTFHEALIEACKKYNVSVMVSDTSKMAIMKADDISWILTEAGPYLIKAGLRKIGVVTPENPFAKKTVDAIIARATVIDIRAFDDLSSAENWLLS